MLDLDSGRSLSYANTAMADPGFVLTGVCDFVNEGGGWGVMVEYSMI